MHGFKIQRDSPGSVTRGPLLDRVFYDRPKTEPGRSTVSTTCTTSSNGFRNGSYHLRRDTKILILSVFDQENPIPLVSNSLMPMSILQMSWCRPRQTEEDLRAYWRWSTGDKQVGTRITGSTLRCVTQRTSRVYGATHISRRSLSHGNTNSIYWPNIP